MKKFSIFNFQFSKYRKGLTLIETIVALYVLTAGVVTIVGTSVYSYSIYSKNTNMVTALNLAREGVEVVRNVRDSNWLSGTLEECPDLGSDQFCYRNWQDKLTECKTANGCQAVFDTGNKSWSLVSTNNYALYKQSDGHYSNTNPGGASATYYRKISVQEVTPIEDPYTSQNPELRIISTVGWIGRGCDSFVGDDPDNAQVNCKIIVESRLTNWKDY